MPTVAEQPQKNLPTPVEAPPACFYSIGLQKKFTAYTPIVTGTKAFNSAPKLLSKMNSAPCSLGPLLTSSFFAQLLPTPGRP